MLTLKFWRRLTAEMLSSDIVDPARTFMRTPAELVHLELQSFAQTHKCCRFKPGIAYASATIFGRINDFVMYDPGQFIVRFSYYGLAILASETCPVMAVIPFRVAEYLGLSKKCIIRHHDALQWTPVTPEAELVQSLRRKSLGRSKPWCSWSRTPDGLNGRENQVSFRAVALHSACSPFPRESAG
jgi:hypothetical protein